MRQLLLVLMLLFLSACDPVSVAAVGATTFASYSVTGKSPLDNTVSALADQDCDLGKADRRDGRYCTPNKIRDDPTFAHVDAPRVYCFPTMGEVECHCSADPFDNRNTPFVRGRGNLSPAAMCSGSAVAVDAGLTYPAAPLSPPDLPPAAYEEIIKPAATPEPLRQDRPLELAPEGS